MVDTVSKQPLSERVRRHFGSLSEGQRRIARFCVNEPERAASLQAHRIGRELGLSESTVVRFAVALGYDGFPAMQAELRGAVEAERKRQLPAPDSPMSQRGLDSLHADATALDETIRGLDGVRITAAVQLLSKATRVFVCGFRTSYSLAFLAAFHMRHINPNVRLIGDVGGTFEDDLLLIGPDDVGLVFTFPVYDHRSLAAIDRAVKVGAKVVVVTDSALAPLPLSDHLNTIYVRHEGESFFNTNVPATALINALTVQMLAARADDPAFEAQVAEHFHIMRSMGDQPS
jgi:DNA-binding MurR/RpiR family transcriptional regulator